MEFCSSPTRSFLGNKELLQDLEIHLDKQEVCNKKIKLGLSCAKLRLRFDWPRKIGPEKLRKKKI